MISIAKLDLPAERDFLFEPIEQTNVTLYAHLVDAKVHSILAKNESCRTVQIPEKHRLGTLCELDYENVFFAEHSAQLAEPPRKPPKTSLRKPSAGASWIKKAATIATAAAFSISATMNSLLPDQKPSADASLAKETRLANGVMVYGDT